MEGVKLELSSRSDLVNAVGMRIAQDFERVVCRHALLSHSDIQYDCVCALSELSLHTPSQSNDQASNRHVTSSTPEQKNYYYF